MEWMSARSGAGSVQLAPPLPSAAARHAQGVGSETVKSLTSTL
jgi:hypothetical protein